jgi:hypothetical protein
MVNAGSIITTALPRGGAFFASSLSEPKTFVPDKTGRITSNDIRAIDLIRDPPGFAAVHSRKFVTTIAQYQLAKKAFS